MNNSKVTCPYKAADYCSIDNCVRDGGGVCCMLSDGSEAQKKEKTNAAHKETEKH